MPLFGISVVLNSAINILAACEGQTGAAARSKSALSGVLKEIGEFDQASDLMQQVTKDLASMGKYIKDMELTEEFFE